MQRSRVDVGAPGQLVGRLRAVGQQPSQVETGRHVEQPGDQESIEQAWVPPGPRPPGIIGPRDTYPRRSKIVIVVQAHTLAPGDRHRGAFYPTGCTDRI